MQFYKTKLNSALKPIVIAIVLIVQVYSIVTALSLNQAITDTTNLYIEESARLASELVSQRIRSVSNSQEQLAKSTEKILQQSDGESACAALLDRYKRAWNYHSLFILYPEELTDTGPSIDAIPRERKLARRAMAQKKTVLGKCSHVEGVAYATPVIRDGEVIAVLIADRGVENTLKLLDIRVFSNAGLIMLVDYENNILMKNWKHSSMDMREHINFISHGNKLVPSFLGPGYDTIAYGQGSFKDSLSHTWLYAQHTYPTFGVSLLYTAPADEIMVNLPSLRWWNIAMHVVSFLFIILLIGELIWLQKAYTKKLEDEQFHDKLTGGDNSAAFAQKMVDLLANTTNAYALITLDINKFKLINDEYGVAKANELLLLVYATLKAHTRQGELYARHTADTFLLLLHYKSEDSLRERIAGMMEDVMQGKHTLGIQHKYGLCAGVYVILAERGMPPYLMLDNANFAREQCKKPPYPSCMFYDESVQEKLRAEAEIMNAFSHSLKEGHFEIWLQPKVNIRTDIVTGAEALVRWNHPEMGFLSPGLFLPMLEENGLIVQLDLWVFEEVCRLLSRWDKEGREIVPIAVNLSRAHLADENFLGNYLQILQAYKIDPHWIELELTETLFQEKEDTISDIFSTIRSHGLRCAIDDFGTGYSSLSMLRAANVDIVKLDRTFFSDPELSEQSKAIIRSITQLASALSLTCVAEGVEDKAVLEFLLTTECSIVQGYLYSKPLTVEAFEAFTYNEEKRRKLLRTGLLIPENKGQAMQHSPRSLQMRNLLSALGNVGVYVINKATRELLYCNEFMKAMYPDAQEGKFCHELWSRFCNNCPLLTMKNGRSEPSIVRQNDFGYPVTVSAVEILWEDYLPAYAITIEPLAQTGEEEEEEEGLQVLRSKMADLLKDAQEDGLTNLLNKRNFEQEVEKSLVEGSKGAFIFIDLDGFKQVNDTFGHLMGDVVLKNTAERIRLSFRRDDIIGRYGGDEFVAYLPTFANKEMLEQRVNALKNLLRHQHTLGGTSCAITASIGIATFPEDGQDYNELVLKADLAVYEAKRRGKDQHAYYSDTLMHKDQHSDSTNNNGLTWIAPL